MPPARGRSPAARPVARSPSPAVAARNAIVERVQRLAEAELAARAQASAEKLRRASSMKPSGRKMSASAALHIVDDEAGGVALTPPPPVAAGRRRGSVAASQPPSASSSASGPGARQAAVSSSSSQKQQKQRPSLYALTVDRLMRMVSLGLAFAIALVVLGRVFEGVAPVEKAAALLGAPIKAAVAGLLGSPTTSPFAPLALVSRAAGPNSALALTAAATGSSGKALAPLSAAGLVVAGASSAVRFTALLPAQALIAGVSSVLGPALASSYAPIIEAGFFVGAMLAATLDTA